MSNIYKKKNQLKASKDLKKMQNLLLKSHDYLRSAVTRRKKERTKRTKFDVYEKLCPNRCLYIKVVKLTQLITGVGWGCKDITPTKLQCQNIQRALQVFYNLKK